MSFDYESAREDAKQLITEFGQLSSFYTPEIAGGYDDRGNAVAGSPRVDYDGIVTPKLDFSQSLIDGENLKQGDGYVFFHSDVKPPINSLIDLNGTTYTLVSVMQELTSVDGVNVYRKLQIRQGA